MTIALEIVFFLSIAGMLLGGSLIWCAQLSLRRTAPRLLMSVVGWVTLIAATITLCLLFGQAMMIVGLPILAGALIIALYRYRASEQQILFWVLTSAAERGVPLWKAAHAFAMERIDPTSVVTAPSGFSVGGQAQVLGNLLQQGAPLMRALSTARVKPDLDTFVALLVGVKFGAMQRSMRGALDIVREIQAQWRWLSTRLGYLIVVGLVMATSVAYIQLNVQPVISQMLGEFEMSTAIMGWESATTFIGAVAIIGVLLSTPVVVGFWVMACLNLLDSDIAFASTFMASLDRARVLRALSWSLAGETSEQDRAITGGADAPRGSNVSLEEAVELLAQGYPKTGIRNRLADALGDMRSGSPWASAMQQRGLLSNVEKEVLLAAERVGNLSWAMLELSNRRTQRFLARLQTIQGLVFPLAVAIAALFALIVIVQVFYPLTQIITVLAE